MTRVRIGVSGWRYASWRGPFYPRGLRQRDELSFAAEQLDSLEINALARPGSRSSAWPAVQQSRVVQDDAQPFASATAQVVTQT